MLFTEQVRILKSEKKLIDDPTPYSHNSPTWSMLEDFEDVTDWTYSEVDSANGMQGGQSTAWKTEGTYSYLLEKVSGVNNLAGDYCKISKNIDLTGITSLKFDCKLDGWSGSSVYARMYIGGALVWGVDFQPLGTFTVEIDVSSYSGVQNVEFMLIYSTDTGTTISNQFYIDNLQQSTAAWGQIKSYGNITLSEAGIVVVSLQHQGGASDRTTGLRIKIGLEYVLCSYCNVAGWVTRCGMIYLPAGTYEVVAESICISLDASLGAIQNFLLGFTKFSDMSGVDEEYTITPGSTQNWSVVNVAQRNTACGQLNQIAIIVNLTGVAEVGDIEVYLDGVLQTPDILQENSVFDFTHGVWGIPASVGNNHTIGVKNLAASSRTIRCQIVATPWLLLDASRKLKPLSLNFPSGSTLYVKAEPLAQDISKTIRLEADKAVGLENTYSSSVGVGLLDWNYTFDIVSSNGVDLVVEGLWGCISFIAVDVR